MKILYLAHRLPYPPNKGDKIRAYHQLRRLVVRHEVHLYTLVDDPYDWCWLPELERLCARVHAWELRPWAALARAARALLTGAPLSPAFFHHPQLVGAVRDDLAAGGYDAIVVFCSAMLESLPAEIGGVPVYADYCDLDSAKWAAYARTGNPGRRLLYGMEARRLARFEAAHGERCDRVVFATPREAQDYRDLIGATSGTGDSTISVIANGVDHAAFDRDSQPRSEQPTVIFTGAMDYRPNFEGARWFADCVWPRVKAAHPDARLLIVGRDPHPAIESLDGSDGIHVTGTVAEIQPFLHSAWLSVAPLEIARGVQNKVLEAMAAGVPTLISPAVAGGLDARNGIDTLVVEGEDAWVAHVSRLLESPAVRRGLAESGLRYVRTHHDWDAHGEAWEALLQGPAARVALEGAA